MNINTIIFAVVCLMFSTGAFTADTKIVEIQFLSDDLEAEDVANYWTPERLEQAQPFPMPGSEDRQLEQESMESGEPGEATATKLKPGKAKEVGPYTHQPYSPAGKLFFSTRKADHYCSAQYAHDKHTILTAAHCLTNTNGHTHSRIAFFRSYNHDGFKPYWSQYAIIKIGYLFEPYISHADYTVIRNTPYDVAVLCAEKSEVTPMRLFTHKNRILKKNPTAIGYPSNFDKGNAMFRVITTDITEFYKVPGEEDFAIIATHGNPFGKGSSGGAWLRTTDDGKKNNAVGINASKLDDYPKVVFSPWFTSEVKNLFEKGKKKCK